MNIEQSLVADRNLFALIENDYPGRLIVVGTDDTGTNMIQLYAIMGRSPNSRNRILTSEGGRLFTEAADPSKAEDPSLIIYNAMNECSGPDGEKKYTVSNGHQTDDINEALSCGRDLVDVMESWEYEPDAPNFTPRISGFCTQKDPQRPHQFELSILRKSPFESCERIFYGYEAIDPGFGYCIHTYARSGNPLPSFKGEPLLLRLSGDQVDLAQRYWDVLNKQNRVALAVKFIPLTPGIESSTYIINQYEKV